MPWAIPLAMVASSAISSKAASDANQEGLDQAKAAYDQSVRDLSAIGIPSVEAQQIVMEQYQSQGKWTPELEQSVKLGDSNYGGISTDPAYKEAQLRSLNSLKDISDSGGMTLSDKAGLEKTMGDISSDQRGRREAILQRAREQGGYGSGTALAAQLMSQQEGATAARQAGLETQAQAQKRALDALSQGGTLATALRGQEYGEKEKAAAAQDAIAKWNAANSADTQSRNVASQNTAAQYNLSNAQNLSNSNTDLRNKQETYNKELLQRNYENQLEVAKAKANARAGQASSAVASGQQAANTIAGLGSAVTQGVAAYGQQQNSNEQRQLDRDALEKRYVVAKPTSSGGAF